MRLVRAAAIIVLFAASAAAQPVTIGQRPPYAPSLVNIGASNFPLTFVDLSHPANANGTVNRAVVDWGSRGCSNAFKVVFLRQNNSLAFFNVVAARGPFNAAVGRNEVTLTPAVTVQEGDMLAVVQLQSQAACGSVLTSDVFHGDSGGGILSNADISVGGVAGPVTILSPGLVASAVAFGSDPVLVRVLPAAGAVAGSGAFFRTAVQMINQGNETVTGRFVFHKQGQSATPSDPSLSFNLGAGRTVSYPDIITTMGSSGLGSIDVFVDGGATPTVTARIFSDGGSAGTSGFFEEGLKPSQAMGFGDTGVLQLPTDTTNFRMNVGVRTLSAGASIDIAWYGANGLPQGTRTVDYAPNFFEQKTANQFTGAATLDPDGWIRVRVRSGDAYIYGTVTDNRTSDSAMRFAGPQ